MPQATLTQTTKSDIKRLIIGLLEKETGDDLSDLARRVDVDLACDLGVDSLSMVNIILDLEDALGVRLKDGEIKSERVRSVEAFSSFLYQKVNASSPRAAAG